MSINLSRLVLLLTIGLRLVSPENCWPFFNEYPCFKSPSSLQRSLYYAPDCCFLMYPIVFGRTCCVIKNDQTRSKSSSVKFPIQFYETFRQYMSGLSLTFLAQHYHPCGRVPNIYSSPTCYIITAHPASALQHPIFSTT